MSERERKGRERKGTKGERKIGMIYGSASDKSAVYERVRRET